MSKKESYKETLTTLLDEALEAGKEEKLKEYLISNSNLPGPRANLELAEAFAFVTEFCAQKVGEKLWKLNMELTCFSPTEAPVNSAMEFLVFCGVRGIGSLGSSAPFFENAIVRLKELASDPRWRTREAVAMAIQTLIKRQPQKTLKKIEEWIEDSNWLAMRAVAAGAAEPALLKDMQTAKSALELHKKIFTKVLDSGERESSEFKTLKQGLGYSLSVVVSAFPYEGFKYMRQLVDAQDEDVLWVIKENLKKNRLTKNFPQEVASMNKLLAKSQVA
ncbi:MAG: hypothetical protein ABSF44_03135 [Candidatus Bathyarchaeia archaeon]|jgi:hypothetical protein